MAEAPAKKGSCNKSFRDGLFAKWRVKSKKAFIYKDLYLESSR